MKNYYSVKKLPLLPARCGGVDAQWTGKALCSPTEEEYCVCCFSQSGTLLLSCIPGAPKLGGGSDLWVGREWRILVSRGRELA